MRSTEIFKENIKILKPKVVHKIAADDPARVALHQSISHLLNEILDEDSTISSAVRRSPYADQLIKSVHKDLAMPHDLQWQPEDKITWADIKSRSPNFVIIQGQDGTGAIKWDGSQWVVMLASKEGVRKTSDGSINILFKDIKDTIGKIRGYWTAVGAGQRERYGKVATNRTSPVDVKRSEREQARKITNPKTMDPNASYSQNFDAVMIKLRPLYAKYIQQALADVKGVIGMAIKNDAFHKAKQKLELLDKLKQMENELIDNPDSIPDRIKTKLRPALYLTASYYYPEDTGNFNMNTSGYRGSSSPDNTTGARKVITDIANGDTEKLTTLMNYLKQTLLHA
jgi:hypothetical protein